MTLPRGEQERIYNELQELQKKDWKELSLDQKKAGAYKDPKLHHSII